MWGETYFTNVTVHVVCYVVMVALFIMIKTRKRCGRRTVDSDFGGSRFSAVVLALLLCFVVVAAVIVGGGIRALVGLWHVELSVF